MTEAPAAPDGLDDDVIEGFRKPLTATLDFIDSLEAVCVKNVQALSSIGGNVMIGIPGVGSWMIVVRGVKPGFFGHVTDDDVDFALLCEEWVLHELLDPECEVDIAAYQKAGVLQAAGELNVLQRLLALAQGGGGNALNLRARQ